MAENVFSRDTFVRYGMLGAIRSRRQAIPNCHAIISSYRGSAHAGGGGIQRRPASSHPPAVTIVTMVTFIAPWWKKGIASPYGDFQSPISAKGVTIVMIVTIVMC